MSNDQSTSDVTQNDLKVLIEKLRSGDVQPRNGTVDRELSPEERHGLRMAADELEEIVEE